MRHTITITTTRERTLRDLAENSRRLAFDRCSESDHEVAVLLRTASERLRSELWGSL